MSVSNAGKGENGWRNQKAGDQTGTEWYIRSWYSYPWDVVIRPKDSKIAEMLADLCEKAAKNNKIGYDMNDRMTYWTQLQKVGYKPEKITVACEADCSSGIFANLWAIGALLNIADLKSNSLKAKSGEYNTTLYMERIFKRTNHFEYLSESKYLTSDKYLKRGDILLNRKNHVCTNLTNGSAVAPSKPVTPAPAPQPQKQPTTPPSGKVKYYAESLDKSLKGTYKVVAKSGLNFRTGAGTGAPIIKTLADGSTLVNYGYYSTIDGVKWLYTDIGGTAGFVSSQYLAKIK